MKAIWNNQVIAQSSDFLIVSGVTFFPAASVRSEYLRPSDMQSQPSEFGTMSFRDVEVEGSKLEGAAIQYSGIPADKPQEIALLNSREGTIDYSNYIGFTGGISIEQD